MVSVHVVLGIAVIGVCSVAAVLGFVAHRRRRGVRPPVSNGLVLAQTLLIAQAVGLLLPRRQACARPAALHLRGARARTRAVAVVLCARGFEAATVVRGDDLVAGALAVRAFMTGS